MTADRLGIVTADLWAMRAEIEAATGWRPKRLRPEWPARVDAVLAWHGPRGRTARWLARLVGAPVRTVVEGPLRSVRLDVGPPASLVFSGMNDRAADETRAAAGLAQLRRLRLSWRNDGRARWPAERGAAPRTLVVVGRPDDARAIAATSPPLAGPVAVMADSRALVALAHAAAAASGGWVAVEGVDPWVLFDEVETVRGGPGDLTRLAVLAGRRVLTRDGRERVEDPARLFAATFLEAPTYFDPWSRQLSDFESVADQLAWLRDRFRDNGRRTVGIGISRWKQERIAGFLDGPEGSPVFVTRPEAAASLARAENGQVVAWETRMPRALEAACETAGVPLLRMEDGFLRSVGLGAAFLPGASCVLDGRGIYYDPRQPSDLEHILANAEFDEALLRRAQALREDVVALRLTKYNVGRTDAGLDLPDDRSCVLVPGQVEDDASVVLGSPAVPGNRALLRAARAGNPDAYLIFKPHPDVEAGLRKGRIPPDEALTLVDRVIGAVPIVDLLDRVDAVETMTSLAGFEALMRGVRTVVHGRPFYAGWGITTDRDPLERRTRRLTLDEMVAGALILYPRYLDPVTGLRCPPEVLVRRLAEARDAARARPAGQAAAQALYARARHALLGPLGMALRRMRGAVRSHRPDGPA